MSWLFEAGKVAVCAGAGMVAAPFLAGPALGFLGFSAAGPVAGGIAAGLQAGIGNVIAGGWFAGAQAIAMGGALPAVGYAGAGAIAGTAGALGTWLGII